MEILKKSKEMFDSKEIKISNKHDKEVVLIEIMDNSDMCEYVIKNVMYFLHNDWNLTIIHGNKNKECFRNITKNIGDVKLINLGIDSFTPFPKSYNKFMTSKDFLNLIESDIFLVTQIDVLLFKPISEKFLKYSYVGAPWQNEIDFGLPCGNGGFSLRNKNDMFSVVNYLEKKKINPTLNEDIVCCLICRLLKLNLPTKVEASSFSSEQIFNRDSCAVHKPTFSESKLRHYIECINW
jgi:hypothetical protein